MPLKKSMLSEFCKIALIGGLSFSAAQAFAVTAAGTTITNLATVTFEDAAGNEFSATSNAVEVNVIQVYSAEVGRDQTFGATPGQSLNVPYVLTNTGNGPDTYALSGGDNPAVVDTLNADATKIIRDLNGNGVVDAGEPEVMSLTLKAGESQALVMQVQLPVVASVGDTLGTSMKVDSPNGAITNITDDSDDGIVEALVTISQGPEVTVSQAATLDATNHTVTYVNTYTNVGDAAAAGTQLIGAIPEGTTLVPSSIAVHGLSVANGDTTPVADTADETVLGVDLNNDGDASDTAVPVTIATDADLAPGQSVSVSYTVAYDPDTYNNDERVGSGGDRIENTAAVSVDADNDPATEANHIVSNLTSVTIPNTTRFSLSDTGEGNGANDAVNDGEDDSPADDGQQLVEVVGPRSNVMFTAVLTNSGSIDDTFELSIDQGSFPPGTVFTFYDENGKLLLTDTNDIDGPDTGPIAPGQSKKVVIEASLPDSVVQGRGVDGYVALLEASSANDQSQSDSLNLVLNRISNPGVDLANIADSADAGTTNAVAVNAGSPTSSRNHGASSGDALTIPFTLDNDSSSPDAFLLTAGETYNGSVVSGMPEGWQVTFYEGDGSGNRVGSAITQTALLPAGTIDKEYIAVVRIPADSPDNLSNYTNDHNGNGTVDVLDGNGDGDGDHPLFIQAASSNSGASDVLLNAIDLETEAQLDISTPQLLQGQPGNTVQIDAALENTGNTSDTYELVTNSTNPSLSIIAMVDTSGDGRPDTPHHRLTAGNVIVGRDVNGQVINIPVTDVDGDGIPEVRLNPGDRLSVQTEVSIPNGTPFGTSTDVSITATSTSSGQSYASFTRVEVVDSKVTLNKTVAADYQCDGRPDSAFEATLSVQIQPNQCAIWQIQAHNAGNGDAHNFIITDEVPDFSSYEVGSLEYGYNSGTNLTPQTDAFDGDDAHVKNEKIFFTVGAQDDNTAQGGILYSGDIATVRFRTKVE